ncbi:hypothetical protein LUZ60_006277 [Juncus effusus]|nr:hypothetical protein LUZ60_006277 [Juncus effusus]
MTKEISTANALGARTTRPCDSCIRRRARVYCIADDAFLCAPCDSSVHSANPLARRHQRLSLTSPPLDSPPLSSPSWSHRKPRTPRPKPVTSKPDLMSHHDSHGTHVPDLYQAQNSEEDLSEESYNYDELLYQVPVYDPDLADQLYQIPAEEIKQEMSNNLEVKSNQVDGVAGFQISEMDLEEFAADMESLLGGPEFEGLMEMEICREGDVREKREKERKELMLKLDYEDVITEWGCKGGSPWTNGERPRLRLDDCWPDNKVPTGRTSDIVGPMYRQTLTSEGREARVSRYREKRRTRLFSKKIRYEVRKLNAEKRPRMKGRFVKRAATSSANCQSLSVVPVQMKMQLPVPVPVMQGHFSF